MLGFLWRHTRVPYCVNRVPVPLAMMVGGFILIMPNLGFNEWGHTFWYAEELFAAPIHWGFVVLGWALFALGGWVLQILNRIRELTAVEPSTIISRSTQVTAQTPHPIVVISHRNRAAVARFVALSDDPHSEPVMLGFRPTP